MGWIRTGLGIGFLSMVSSLLMGGCVSRHADDGDSQPPPEDSTPPPTEDSTPPPQNPTGFAYVSGVKPSKAYPGDTVRVVGARLTGDIVIRFDNYGNFPPTFVGDGTAIDFVVPNVAPGVYKFDVCVNGNAVKGVLKFQVCERPKKQAPRITAVQVSSAYPGDVVRIVGTGLRGDVVVRFEKHGNLRPDFIGDGTAIDFRIPSACGPGVYKFDVCIGGKLIDGLLKITIKKR